MVHREGGIKLNTELCDDTQIAREKVQVCCNKRFTRKHACMPTSSQVLLTYSTELPTERTLATVAQAPALFSRVFQLQYC